jgi:hypothetical protein
MHGGMVGTTSDAFASDVFAHPTSRPALPPRGKSVEIFPLIRGDRDLLASHIRRERYSLGGVKICAITVSPPVRRKTLACS